MVNASGSLGAVQFLGAGTQTWNELASKLLSVGQRIEPANQEGVDAELVVFEQCARDLLGGADQTGGVAQRAGRLGNRHPQPLVVRLAGSSEVEQAAGRLVERLLAIAKAGRVARLLDRSQNFPRAIPRGALGRAEDRPEG